jgi:hypothetical protein
MRHNRTAARRICTGQQGAELHQVVARALAAPLERRAHDTACLGGVGGSDTLGVHEGSMYSNERKIRVSCFLFALGALAAAGCKSSVDAQESARAEEKMNLLTNPSLFLPTTDREWADTDQQLTSMVVSNTSHFAVAELTGDVVWFDDQERRLGSTPFSLSGSIAGGQSKRFSTGDGSMQSGKLHSIAGAVQVVFTHVKVVDGEKGL